VAAFGRAGQAAALRQQDLQRISVLSKAGEEAIVSRIKDIDAQIQKQHGSLTERLQSVWTELKLKKELVTSLDELGGDLLTGKKDRRAALEVMDARLAYSRERGLPSPQYVVLRNTLRAALLAVPNPSGTADRLKRAEEIERLGRETILAARQIPNGAVFDPDRVQVLTAGAKLIQWAVVYARGERSGPLTDAWFWDPRADYAARVLRLALSLGTVADPGGHARITRASLLAQRGLIRQALDEVGENPGLWDDQPAYLVQAARLYALNNDGKRALEVFEAALKAGFRPGTDFHRDGDLRTMWALRNRKDPPQIFVDRDNPKIAVYLTANPLTVKNAIPTYDVKIVNNGGYPLVGVKVECAGTSALLANFKERKTPFVSKKLVLDYVGPAGSGREEYVWPNAIAVAGTIENPVLRVELAHKTTDGKVLKGEIKIETSREVFRPYWW
jgi:hypothetical protein